MRDPSTGQEVERPYHEGMEQQLPERFKVKFTALMPKGDDPVSVVPPGRSFLFLHPKSTRGSMPLLGVVEEVRLVETSPHPTDTPHVYHLDVRRIQAPGQANIAHPGVDAGVGAALRHTLLQHFGLSVGGANAAVVVHGGRHSASIKQILHLPGGTPRMPA